MQVKLDFFLIKSGHDYFCNVFIEGKRLNIENNKTKMSIFERNKESLCNKQTEMKECIQTVTL